MEPLRSDRFSDMGRGFLRKVMVLLLSERSYCDDDDDDKHCGGGVEGGVIATDAGQSISTVLEIGSCM